MLYICIKETKTKCFFCLLLLQKGEVPKYKIINSYGKYPDQDQQFYV